MRLQKFLFALTNPKRGILRLKKHTLFFFIFGVYDILNASRAWRAWVGKNYPFHALVLVARVYSNIVECPLPPGPAIEKDEGEFSLWGVFLDARACNMLYIDCDDFCIGLNKTEKKILLLLSYSLLSVMKLDW